MGGTDAPLAVMVTLVVYQAALLGLGFWARRRARTATGYFIGDHGVGPWTAALSYAAGSSSAWSILGVSGIAFTQGLSAVWLLPGTLTGHVVVWFWVAPRLQQLSTQRRWVTLTDLLADGLPRRTRRLTYVLAAGIILFSFTFYIAAQFQGAADTFGAVFGFDFLTALLIGASVVLVYTLWGGFWAVSVTDALQAVLMLVAALTLPVLAVVEVGGLNALNRALDTAPYGSFTGGHTGWFLAGLLLGMLSIGFGPVGQPHLLNRIMAMRERRDIVLARAVALTWFVAVLGGMFVLGLCAHVLKVAEGAGEQVFFVMADRLLPVVLTGVLIAAVLSAIMSTADSQLLVAGSAVAHDLRSGQSASTSGTGRVAVLGVAVAALLLAAFLPEAIFSRVLFAWNALGAAFGPLVLARLAGWRLAPWSVPAALLLGFGLTVVFYSLPDGPGDVWERALPFVVAGVTLWVARASVTDKS